MSTTLNTPWRQERKTFETRMIDSPYCVIKERKATTSDGLLSGLSLEHFSTLLLKSRSLVSSNSIADIDIEVPSTGLATKFSQSPPDLVQLIIITMIKTRSAIIMFFFIANKVTLHSLVHISTYTHTLN